MKDLFEYIKSVILTNIPEIKTVRMWNTQTDHENGKRDEKPFRYPACFVEFVVDEVQNFSLGIKNVHLTVRFRFALEQYTFERLQDLDFNDNFDSVINGLQVSETDSVRFSTFQESNNQQDEDFNNVDEPYVEYKTVWRKTSAYQRKGQSVINVDVDVEFGGFISIETDLYLLNEAEGSSFLYNESEEKQTYIFNEWQGQ